MGSNPVWVTNSDDTRLKSRVFLFNIMLVPKVEIQLSTTAHPRDRVDSDAGGS